MRRRTTCARMDVTKEDICAHLGDDYDRFLGAAATPIFQTSLFVNRRTERRDDDERHYAYTRVSNPTTEVAERKIAALEDAEAALCFSSGMAAITAAVMHSLTGANHVILVRNSYGPTKLFLERYMQRFGVTVTYVSGDTTEEFERSIRPDTRLIYLESPTTSIFSMQDLRAVSALARAQGIATIIDNSWATPMYQNPIPLGIDMVVHSASKYLGGHSDIVGGVVVGRKQELDTMIEWERGLLGAVMDPHQSWLLLRGLRTLPVRMRQHQENALQIASFLAAHPKVKRVLYPGLKSHPQYELGTRQMSGYSGLLSFVPVGSPDRVFEFMKGLRFFQSGPSWGGYESLVSSAGVGMDEETSARTGIPQGTVRISVGLENVNTLMDDLDQGLSRL